MVNILIGIGIGIGLTLGFSYLCNLFVEWNNRKKEDAELLRIYKETYGIE